MNTNEIKDLNEFQEKIESKLKNTFPNAQDVGVSINETPSGNFKTLVSVAWRGSKHLVAVKEGPSPWKSASRAEKAVRKQISKIKARWKKRKKTYKDKLISLPASGFS